MKSQAARRSGCILLYLFFSYIVFFLPVQSVIQLTREDGFFESLNAVWLISTSILFLILYFRDKKGNDLVFLKTHRNIFFLLLAIAFFFGFGEEISWGQRIFNWKTSPWFLLHNNQSETNIHNLSMFHNWTNFDHLFTYFWVAYCLVIPFLCSMSAGLASWLRKMNLPLIPYQLSLLFLMNYLIFILLKFNLVELLKHPVTEVKETCLGFLFLISAIYFVWKNRLTRTTS